MRAFSGMAVTSPFSVTKHAPSCVQPAGSMKASTSSMPPFASSSSSGASSARSERASATNTWMSSAPAENTPT